MMHVNFGLDLTTTLKIRTNLGITSKGYSTTNTSGPLKTSVSHYIVANAETINQLIDYSVKTMTFGSVEYYIIEYSFICLIFIIYVHV